MRVLKVHLLFVLFLSAFLCAVADPVPVRHKEGLTRGFLVLRSEDGKIVAHGDLLQNSHDDEVTTRLVFHFKDGSVYDETTVFLQREQFKLLSDHLVCKGKSFDSPMESSMNATTGQVEVRYKDKDGTDKVRTEHIDFPADAANGMVMILLKNLAPDSVPTSVSMVATQPKVRVVKLKIQSAGQDSFTIAGVPHKARHFVLKVDIGGLAGAAAHILGKQPPDTDVWILEGEAPTFLKSTGPLAAGSPVWQIELTSPVWPAESPASKEEKKK